MADTAVHQSVETRAALREPGPVAAVLLLTFFRKQITGLA